MSTKNRRKKRVSSTEILRRIVLVLSILVFVSCAVLLILDYLPNVETPDSGFLDKADIFDNSQSFQDEKSEILVNINNMRKENPDMVGFISIKGMKINYPIVKGEDNDYYLHYNFYRKKDRKGTIMLDAYSDEKTSLNWLIYGHSMKNRTMFGSLRDFTKKSFYNDHKSMIVTMHDEVAVFDIFAVCYTAVYPSDDPRFKYHYYGNIFTENDYNEYVANIKKLSLYDTGITPQFGEQLVTLSTCRESNSPRRIVVVARRRSE